jgi:hypothetical protein
MDWTWLHAVVRQFIASEAFSTLVAGAFGAAFGAWGAQAVISRGQKRQAIVAELNSVNAALTLCFAITNRFAGLKRQHVRGMRDRYEQAHQDFEASRKAPHPGGAQKKVIDVRADLQAITPVKVPIERLESYLFEKMAIRGRALLVATELTGAIDGLERSIKYRNDLIAEIHGAALNPLALAERYFGITDVQGRTDERFRAAIAGIFNQTDDCIFFARILADDLLAYGTKLRRRYIWRFRSRFPKFVSADWSIAEAAGLIPPNAQYADWLKGFKKTETRAQRTASYIRVRLPSGTAIKEKMILMARRVRATASEIYRSVFWRRRRRKPRQSMRHVKPLPLP